MTTKRRDTQSDASQDPTDLGTCPSCLTKIRPTGECRCSD